MSYRTAHDVICVKKYLLTPIDVYIPKILIEFRKKQNTCKCDETLMLGRKMSTREELT